MAVTPTVAQLVDEVRLITDRKNDPTLTDSTIVTYLNDGVRSMYDAFLDSAPHWVQSSFDFTLVGDSDETSLVALPDDFKIDRAGLAQPARFHLPAHGSTVANLSRPKQAQSVQRSLRFAAVLHAKLCRAGRQLAAVPETQLRRRLSLVLPGADRAARVPGTARIQCHRRR